MHPRPFKSRRCGGGSAEECWASESCSCRSLTQVKFSIIKCSVHEIFDIADEDVDVITGGGATVAWAAHCWVSVPFSWRHLPTPRALFVALH